MTLLCLQGYVLKQKWSSVHLFNSCIMANYRSYTHVHSMQSCDYCRINFAAISPS